VIDFDQLWNYNQPAETEKRFRELLTEAETSGDKSYHAQLLTQIARTQGLQRHFDSAHKTLDAVQAMLTDDLTTARIRYLLERGRVFNSSQKRDQARPLFLQAWELAQYAGEDSYAVDAAHMIAIVESAPDQQIEWNLKALKLAENSSQPGAQKWLGSLYNNIGWTYHDSCEYEKALEIFQKALHWREQKGDAQTIFIARWCIGRTLRSLGRLDEALAVQRGLLKEIEAGAPSDGYVYEELGELLLLKNDPEAPRYFRLAYTELAGDAWFAANEPARLERLKTVGNP